jgi:hypothetical protein
MNIGFDFDKVFIDYPPGIPDYLFDKFYKKKANGVLLYRIPSRPEQLLRKLTHLPFLRPVIRENLIVLKRISKKNNKLYLVSSRFGFLEQRTTQLIKKHGFDQLFDGLFFNYQNEQPHLFKSTVIKKLQLDLYIDDDLHLLRYVARHNKKTKFFWLNKTKSGAVTFNITAVTKLEDSLPKTVLTATHTSGRHSSKQ